MNDTDIEACRAAIAALEGQRATLGDTVLELATAPLRARLAALLRPAGLKHCLVTVLFADVVGSTALANGIEADNTAMGAAVNIAARMEQHAPPGGLRISHDTWSQVRGLFELEAQPVLQVKGIAAPMQTYLVRGALERSVASVERGLQGLATPMVGRNAELQRLGDAVAQARETRHLQALTLIGDVGLGKSRLLVEGLSPWFAEHGERQA